jgi:hypothetical protein
VRVSGIASSRHMLDATHSVSAGKQEQTELVRQLGGKGTHSPESGSSLRRQYEVVASHMVEGVPQMNEPVLAGQLCVPTSKPAALAKQPLS